MEAKEPKDVEKYQEHYSEEGLWDKIRNVAKKAGKKVIEYALYLYYVLQDGNVSVKDKAIIIGALGYFILPIDLIPDVLVGVGYTDDLAGLVFAFNKIKESITPEVEAKVQAKMQEFFG